MTRDNATRLNTGTLAMLLIVVVAVAAASFSWWFRARATSRALALWGAERVQLIQTGQRVSLARLSGAQGTNGSESSEDIPSTDGNADQSGGVPLQDVDLEKVPWRDISHARGLIHLRQALVEDRSFAWKKSGPTPNDDETILWRYALRFGDGQSQMTVVLSDGGDWMLIPADGRWVSTEPIAAGLTTFLAEQFDEPVDEPVSDE